ncbi:MAG: DUF4832 domain-containing protein [Eubacterium sp.]|nr:DUF4832 domain-containing protein [Eubacterium sp.]
MKKKRLVALLLAFFMLFGMNCLEIPDVIAATKTMNTTEKVKSLKVTKKAESTVTLKWKKVKNADGYKVYRSVKKSAGYKAVATCKSVNKTSVKIKGLKSNKVYYFKVRAYDKVDGKTVFSKFSKIVKVKTTAKKGDKTLSTTSEKTTEQVTTEDKKPVEDPNKLVDHEQTIDLTETKDTLNNPDQGFYRTVRITAAPEGKRFIYGGIPDKGEYDYDLTQIANGPKFIHIRADLSQLSEKVNGVQDYDLSADALDDFSSMLKAAYDADISVIIRFCYCPDFGNASDMEPDISRIEGHIKQLGSVINNYQETVTAVEAGMVGPWGEMHTSKICDKYAPENLAIVTDVNKRIIDSWLSSTEVIPILVRTPWRLYMYKNMDSDTAYSTVSLTGKEKRLGVYNDAFQSNETDTGTYIYGRDGEISWMKENLASLPFGGEAIGPDSTYHDINKCIPEMKNLHLSYLNYEWNQDVVVKKWQNTQKYDQTCGDDSLYYGETAYKYIEDHMGYRFVPKSAKLSYNEKRDSLNVSVGIDNKGFGNLTKTKNVSLIFVELDANGNETANKFEETNCASYSGEKILKASISFTNNKISADKSYNVYVRLDDGKGHYTVKFANKQWNNSLKANKIGVIEAKKDK